MSPSKLANSSITIWWKETLLNLPVPMVHSGIEGLLFLITQPDLIQDKHNLVFLSVTENK